MITMEVDLDTLTVIRKSSVFVSVLFFSNEVPTNE